MEFGLLLPHFGDFADRDLILDGARRAEALGFDSVWVRDHLLFEPHGEFEQPNTSFLEAFIVLTAVGAVTERIQLGTGALIPFRHPLTTALTVSTMTNLLGPRMILGMGGGTFDHEFEAVGLGGVFRPDLVETHGHLLPRLWTEDGVSHEDDVYSFKDVSIEPKPLGDVPFWYCGNTPASARRAVAYCDGWIPGRIGLATLQKRVATIDELSVEQDRPRPTVGIIPSTSIAEDRDRALASVNVDGLLEWANSARFWVPPPSGRFERREDLDGVLIAGTPDDAVAACQRLDESGVDHLVFDCRMSFDRWLEQLELIGREVLPRLR